MSIPSLSGHSLVLENIVQFYNYGGTVLEHTEEVDKSALFTDSTPASLGSHS